ncbi:PP2C family protein-serine/threonine phosphatase [Streptomyces sp. NPDC001273]|uniref:PP2C family protein-serine/threonine phosphatase n=1 Tax=unclassified Streptomyces TaxID=2593676 RepID=UPI003407D692
MTLAGTLEAAEAAAPVESLDVVARMLQERLGAVSVSFLITDFTGSSVVRLGAAGSTEFVNAGHPWPLRMRDGQVREISPKVDMPFGFDAPHSYRVQSLDLRPGDRLVMLTDGMLEHNAGSLDLSGLIVRTRALHPREAARTLIAAVVDANDGHLQDDATVMCLDWHGTSHVQRDAATGADLTDASQPSRTGRTTPGR